MQTFAVGNFVMDEANFYAEMIEDCINRRFTKEVRLMRYILRTSETNLVEVQQTYQQLYSIPLRQDVEVSPLRYCDEHDTVRKRKNSLVPSLVGKLIGSQFLGNRRSSILKTHSRAFWPL